MGDVSRWLDGRQEYGALFIRVFAGIFLIYMSQDNVFSSARMAEFEKFLGQFRFPLPAIAAPISVYAQFLGGICFLVGVLVRPAAALMTVNFIVALIMVHTKLPFREALDPAAMLASALFLLVHGPGPFSIESGLRRRHAPRAP
jgi:putative oxidoreductase